MANQIDSLDLVELQQKANEQRVRDFTEILDRIDTLDDKKKQLWIEIYENCISDRQNAYALFTNLIAMCESKSTEWAIHGKTIVSLQERMSRAVDQLLKLADLVHKAEKAAESIDPESIYNQLS